MIATLHAFFQLRGSRKNIKFVFPEVFVLICKPMRVKMKSRYVVQYVYREGRREGGRVKRVKRARAKESC